MTEAYPLQWPMGRPRTAYREDSRFDATPAEALKALLRECDLMGGNNIVVSTNVELRRDGLPYANRTAPVDPGVAVYFVRKGQTVCFSCDRYRKVWENMRAIQKTIEAMRGIERWGAHEVIDQMFFGFTALPPPKDSTWWELLGVPASASMTEVNAAFKRAYAGAADDTVRRALIDARDKALKVVS